MERAGRKRPARFFVMFITLVEFGPQPHCSAHLPNRPEQFPCKVLPQGIVHDHLIIPKNGAVVTIYCKGRTAFEANGWRQQIERTGYANVRVEWQRDHPMDPHPLSSGAVADPEPNPCASS